MQRGKLYGIGVGPGDPELLTLKARRLLGEVPVLLIPRSSQEKRSLALSVVEDFLREDQEQAELLLPMTRDTKELDKHWRRAALQVMEKLKRGKNCAFITLGDPGTYSTFSYLLRYVLLLDADIEVELVPGVSAIHAAAAWVGEPLAEGDENLVITTGFRSTRELEEAFERFDNMVVMKAGKSMDKIISFLEKRGPLGKAIFTNRIGFADAFYTKDLQEVKHKSFDYLSTFIIKKEPGGMVRD